jgi:hypothetical protein
MATVMLSVDLRTRLVAPVVNSMLMGRPTQKASQCMSGGVVAASGQCLLLWLVGRAR